ncbi:MAG: transcriptional regulator, partial [Caldilineae bacterium]
SKMFVGRKPRTYLAISPAGRQAFDEHVAALQAILQTSDLAGRSDEEV